MEIVNFGKYRNQPVEVLLTDQNYCDWLMAQDWFRTKYITLMARLQNINEPEETPEHNALQALFLDNDFIRRFVSGSFFEYAFRKGRASDDTSELSWRVEFEERGFDVILQTNFIANDEFYEGGYLIELKPTIGDEYPAIMRQMKSADERARRGPFAREGHLTLIAEKLTSTVLGLTAMRDYFRTANIELHLVDEIRARG